MKLYERYFKRILDFTLSLIAIIVLSPILAIVAILVRVKLGSPVLFIQERPGLNNRIFKMYKFRTMTDEKDEEGNLLPENLRATKIGNIIRNLSIDELPELLNILKGEMSFIGPRPLLSKYLPYYTEIELKRHNVKPGLTGLAQISGRSFLTWEEKFECDVLYSENISFKEDLKILILTIAAFFRKNNIAEVSQTKEDIHGTFIEYNGRKYRPFDDERKVQLYENQNH